MPRILVLGAGFVAGPLINYLSQHGYHITVASYRLADVKALQEVYRNISVMQLNVTDAESLGLVVSSHDLTISFLPFQYHLAVARQCVKFSKHLVTASYETPEMQALHQQALDNDVTIMNEIGLDPGIDHLSAMQIIDSIHQQGGQIESFVSWCGGLPAPQANDNPLGYKFAWSPKSVLMALLNDAVYLKAGQVVTIPGTQLLQNVQSVAISPTLKLEGYPNRDSLRYRDIYGIEEAKDVLRGTLRYPGFSEILHCCKTLGLLDTHDDLVFDVSMCWPDLIEQRLSVTRSTMATESSLVINALDWLGLFDPQQMVAPASSMMDAFCHLLVEKLSYSSDESDMVILQHQFKSINVNGTTKFHRSTLILEGEAGGYSAMAKTVGIPAAIAADLILSGCINQRGVILPIRPDIYIPILAALKKEGISFEEIVTTDSDVVY